MGELVDYRRLGDSVLPTHYNLFLQPDLEQCTFTGKVEIALDVISNVSEIVLNANAFKDVKLIKLARLSPPASKSPQDQSTKRKREQVPDSEPDQPKRIRPCPGRFKRTESASSNSDDEVDNNSQDKQINVGKDQVTSIKDTTASIDDLNAKADDDNVGEKENSDNKDNESASEEPRIGHANKTESDDENISDNKTADSNIKEDSSSKDSNSDTEEAKSKGSSNDNSNKDSESDTEEVKSKDGSKDSEDSEEELRGILKCFIQKHQESKKIAQEEDTGSAACSHSTREAAASEEQNSPLQQKEPENEEASTSKAQQEEEEKPNDNVKVEKKGLLLLRSEWKEADESSSDQDEAKTNFEDHEIIKGREGVDDNSGDDNDADDASDHSDDDDDMSSADDEREISGDDEEEVEDFVLDGGDDDVVSINSSDDDDAGGDKTVNVDSDDEDDDDGVMQVDGTVDFDDSENTVDEGNLLKHSEVPVESFTFLRKEEVILIKSNVTTGNYVLELEFEGNLDDSMRGFYRTKHIVNGQEKWGAACHFEATGARKCFPCFDQPGFRSTFSIRVKRPNKQVEVLSNMAPLREDEDGVVEFGVTPALPTYLVCVIVGYYDRVSRRTEDGVQVSVFTQISQTVQAEYALDIAEGALRFYKQFFGVPYTLPKMDMVAVPDFYIGAMENWGLLTFRETALMFHPTQSTLSRKQYVAILVCHEIAHQWFGNLVSVAWWDQLWLKEGFATWISYLAVDHLFPEFDIWSDFMATERIAALELDTLRSSHPIQVTVNDPGQIDEVFDAISYCKGASIINMLYHWVGKDQFKAGLNRYLVKHGNSSATTSDLWQALEDEAKLADGQPSVETVMNAWTTLQGFPRILVEERDDKIVLRQESFSGDVWNVPLRIARHQSNEAETVILGEEPISLVDQGGWILVNAGQTSFTRVNYTPQLLLRLQPAFRDLDVRDRVGLLSDLCSLVVSGSEPVGKLLELVEWFVGETEWVVVEAMLGVLSRLEALTESSKAYTGFLRLARRLLGPTLASLGWRASEDEANKVFSRAAVIARLGRLGCVDTGSEASLLFWREEGGRDKVPIDIRASVYKTVARKEWSARQRVLDYFMNMYKKADRAEEKRLILGVLASFNDDKIIQQILDWSLSEEVKPQDRVFLIAGVAENSTTGRQRAWLFFKNNFGLLTSLYTSGCLINRLVKGVTMHFKTEPEMQEIKEFFKNHPVPGSEMTVSQTLEDMQALIQRRQHTLDDFLEYFARSSIESAQG